MKPKLQKELVSVSLALNIFKLGNSMVSIFVPLVILQAGGQLWMIGLYYLVYAFAKLCINYNAMKVILKRGAHLGLGLGFLFGTVQLFLILGYSVNGGMILMILSALSLAMTNAFVWNAQHSFISQVMDDETKSSSIATIEIIGKAIGIVGPLIGGGIGFFFGSFWLLAAATIVLLLTFLPIRRMGRLKPAGHEGDIRYNLSGAPMRDLVANFSFNVETTISIMFWPVYLAVVLKTFESIGAIAAIAAAAAIVTTWIAGHRGDKGHDRLVLKQGVAAVGITNIIRIFAMTPLTIGIVSAAYQAAFSYLQNSWVSTYYAHAKTRGPQYIISMEIACDVAYVVVWGILLGVILLSGSSSLLFIVAFVVAAVAAWGCLFLTKQVRT